MSWCSCVSSVFVAASPDSAELMFQAALDCFVSCLPSPSKRLALAKAIAAKLNLTKDKVTALLPRSLLNLVKSVSFC